MNSTEQESQPLRRASVACVACRERRIKCDGDSGQRGAPCSQCKVANRSCVYRFDDRRKRSSSKAYIQALQERIAALEQGKVSENKRLGKSSLVNSFTHLHPPEEDNSQLADAASPQLEDRESRNAQKNSAHIMLNTKSMTKDFGLLRVRNLGSQSDVNGTILDSPTTNRLESTKGNLSADENGQFHYFGYTSNLQVVSFLPVTIPPLFPPSPLQTTGEGIEELADSSSVKNHLLDLYFTYQHPALPVLDEATFRNEYLRGTKQQYYSPFLLYSILLRSLRLSDQVGIQELAGVYLHRARSEIFTELETPTVATIQALCIFGHYLGSLGNDRACWMYPGMAFRLIYDLGLHQDCLDLMNAGYLTQTDRKVRHMTLWGCYIMDKLYSSFQGRPTSLKLEDISVPPPSRETVGAQYQLLSAWTQLARILGDIINIINKSPESLEDIATLSNLSHSGEKLLRWLKGLPTELQWDPKKGSLPAPGVCALHMEFLTTTILLHRPFATYRVHAEGGKVSKRQLEGYSPALSQQICTMNAMRISKIILAFQQQYGIEKIVSIASHIVFTAALSLISEIASETGGEKTQERKWLGVCFKIQEDLAPSLLVARRNLLILKSILECCGYPEPADSTNREQEQADDILMEETEIPLPKEPAFKTMITENDRRNTGPMEFERFTDVNDFDFSEFFPQSMQSSSFGNWTSNSNFGIDTNMDSGQLRGFEQQQGNEMRENPGLSLDLSFSRGAF